MTGDVFLYDLTPTDVSAMEVFNKEDSICILEPVEESTTNSKV
jgi:hypothetical protein